jgi:hypothetical protein
VFEHYLVLFSCIHTHFLIELYKDVLIHLIDDYQSLNRIQQQHFFVGVESIKSAIYKHFPKMRTNFANSQARLFIHRMTQTIKSVAKDFYYLCNILSR